MQHTFLYSSISEMVYGRQQRPQAHCLILGYSKNIQTVLNQIPHICRTLNTLVLCVCVFVFVRARVCVLCVCVRVRESAREKVWVSQHYNDCQEVYITLTHTSSPHIIYTCIYMYIHVHVPEHHSSTNTWMYNVHVY